MLYRLHTIESLEVLVKQCSYREPSRYLWMDSFWATFIVFLRSCEIIEQGGYAQSALDQLSKFYSSNVVWS